MNIINKDEIFHAHTYRCGHASDDADEAYVMRAIKLGAKKITFTDHAPFPGNLFSARMKYEELEEYLTSLKKLKSKYQGIIAIATGLEIEYLPSYREYLSELRDRVEYLLLGQHFCEAGEDEAGIRQTVGAMIEGMQSGFFDGVAHPDLCFCDLDEWTDEAEKLADTLIEAVRYQNIEIEYNLSSREWDEIVPEFWNKISETDKIVIGTDAHSVQQLDRYKIGVAKWMR